MRSKEEVVQSAYIADAMHMLPFLKDALLLGDDTCHADCVFYLGPILLAYEHDPGFWHGEERLERDLRKTEKLLASSDKCVVLRCRIDAPRLEVDHPRCVVVETKSTSFGKRLVEIAAKLAEHLPEPFASRLRSAHGGQRKAAELHAEALYKEICPDYETKVKERADFLADAGLSAIDAEKLVGIPMSVMHNSVAYLTGELGMAKAKIAAFPQLLACSVEANLKPTVAYLKDELGMAKAKIAAFPQLLGCSVEANLKHTVSYLTGELGMAKAKIAAKPQLLGYSVEANIKPTVAYLTGELGMAKAKIAAWPQLLGYSVEANLKPTVAYLKDELGMAKAKIAAWPQLLSYSVEANLKPTVAYLKGELGMAKAKIAAQPRLLGCSVEANLKPKIASLCELGLDGAGVAARCPQLLWKNIKTNIKPTRDWLVNTAELDIDIINKTPSLLTCSIETMDARLMLAKEAGIPNKRIGPSVLRNMKVEAARKAWEAHGRRDMSVRDKMNLIMSV